METERLDDLVEVTFDNKDDFLKIAETLTRIGIASETKNELYQSAHILHKKGKYYILSFKELFVLDGKPSSFSEDDRKRRNTIIQLLLDWGLIGVANKSMIEEQIPKNKIKVIKYNEKHNWKLISKYNIGNKK
jgi:hypothetical protein